MNPRTKLERHYTAQEIAEATSCSDQHVYNAIKRGELRAVRIGRSVRVTESALVDWQGSVAATAETPADATETAARIARDESPTLRDRFAMAAMMGTLAQETPDWAHGDERSRAEWAYKQADAMLAARSGGGK